MAVPKLSRRTAGAGAGRAAPRRWLLSLCALFALASVQLVPGVALGEAQAQTTCYSSSATGTPTSCTREAAYAECSAHAAPHSVSCTTYGAPSGYSCQYRNAYGNMVGCAPSGYRYYPWSTVNGGCPVGSTWDEGSKTCFSADECLAMPDEDVGAFNVTLSGGAVCDGVCKRTYSGGTLQSITTGSGATITVGYGGKLKTSGAACATGDGEMPSASEQACITDSATGRQTCINKQGKQCYQLGSMTKQICWEPGQTGELTSGAELQVRNAGNLPVTPQTQPPAGDTFVQQGTPTTSTTTTTNNTTNTTTTNTTTVTNYVTQSGVDAGDNDAGEPSDGSGSGEGSGEGEGETNGLLGDIKAKLGELVDGWKGDGLDHAGDGASEGDTDVWADDEVIDETSLDTAGMGGSSDACPAVWQASSSGGFSSYFTIENPTIWCDWVSKVKTILIMFAVMAGIVLIWKN